MAHVCNQYWCWTPFSSWLDRQLARCTSNRFFLSSASLDRDWPLDEPWELLSWSLESHHPAPKFHQHSVDPSPRKGVAHLFSWTPCSTALGIFQRNLWHDLGEWSGCLDKVSGSGKMEWAHMAWRMIEKVHCKRSVRFQQEKLRHTTSFWVQWSWCRAHSWQLCKWMGHTEDWKLWASYL